MEEVEKKAGARQKSEILGIFAKQPLVGSVKTRLCPPLNLTQAANLYAQALRETVTRMQALKRCDLAICYSGERCWFEAAFPGTLLVPQQGADLGERMAERLSGWLAAGYDRAVLIGSDAPDLPLERIDQAFDALARTEVVIGPALDGGYYLVGETRHQPELFAGIRWSTAEVLQQTLERTAQLGIRTLTLAPWDDLDDLPALLRLLQRSPDTATAAHVRLLLGQQQESLT